MPIHRHLDTLITVCCHFSFLPGLCLLRPPPFPLPYVVQPNVHVTSKHYSSHWFSYM